MSYAYKIINACGCPKNNGLLGALKVRNISKSILFIRNDVRTTDKSSNML